MKSSEQSNETCPKCPTCGKSLISGMTYHEQVEGCSIWVLKDGWLTREAADRIQGANSFLFGDKK